MEQLQTMLYYIILGVIQGFTEPLPISSSGHLVIAQHFFGIKAAGLHLEVFLNSASLIAVFIVYRKDLVELIAGTFAFIINRKESDKASFRLSMLLILGTIPAVVVGGLFSDFIGGDLKGIHIVTIGLLITGAALWIIRNLKGTKSETEISVMDTLVIGIAQTIALVPGISRSGATVVAGMARKLKPEVSLKFSFFLSIPVSIGSLVFKSKAIIASLTDSELMAPYIAAFVVALIVSILAIKLLINLVTNSNLIYLAIYCFVASILLFIFG